MAGTRTNYTLAEAKVLLAKVNVHIASNDGEYTVSMEHGEDIIMFCSMNIVECIEAGLEMSHNPEEWI